MSAEAPRMQVSNLSHTSDGLAAQCLRARALAHTHTHTHVSRAVQGLCLCLCREEVCRQLWGLQGLLRVVRTPCAVCFYRLASPLFTQRFNELEHVRVVETAWNQTKVRSNLQKWLILTRQCDTISGVKELLQSSWCSLQFLILVGLQDHLQKVKLFHQSGLWTALGLIFLQVRPILYQLHYHPQSARILNTSHSA